MAEEKWVGDGLGPEDFTRPELKLIQNTGGETAKELGARPGDFYISFTDDVIPGEVGLDIVVVGMTKHRTYWGRLEIEDTPPECSSIDGVWSIDGLYECQQCERRNDTPWLLPPEERRKMCLANYNVLAINIADQMPLLIRASGVNTGAVRALHTQLALNKNLKGQWYRAYTHVSSAQQQTSFGPVFTLKFSKLQPVPAEQIDYYRESAVALLGTPIEIQAPEELQIPESASKEELITSASSEAAETQPIDTNF